MRDVVVTQACLPDGRALRSLPLGLGISVREDGFVFGHASRLRKE